MAMRPSSARIVPGSSARIAVSSGRYFMSLAPCPSIDIGARIGVPRSVVADGEAAAAPERVEPEDVVVRRRAEAQTASAVHVDLVQLDQGPIAVVSRGPEDDGARAPSGGRRRADELV